VAFQIKLREIERQSEVEVKNLLSLGLGTFLVQSRKLKHEMGWTYMEFKCLGKRSDGDNFILISVSIWVSGSRWYTSDFDVVDYGTVSLKSPHLAQGHLLRPLKQHLAGQLFPSDAKVKQVSPSPKDT
jgi:hypothetical protein